MNAIIKNSGRVLLTLAMVVCAAVVGVHLWKFYMEAPWTRDGRVCADVVHIAPDVSGLIRDVRVKDNQLVHKGDVLFRIDPKRFSLALKQANTQVASTAATLRLAEKDYKRYSTLESNKVASVQRRQEAETDLKQARAAYNKALAAQDVARLNVTRATVRATVDGKITNFSLRPGNYAQAGTAVAALVDAHSFYVAGYFEETKLPNIHDNDPVRIDIMGEDSPIYGHVASVAGGIQDTDNTGESGSLASVSPTFSWVRLAQRIPVRVTIDKLPKGVRLIVGRTATVSVLTHREGGLMALLSHLGREDL